MVREFCTLCASKLEKIRDNLFHCQNCGQDFYINPCPSNGVILLNEKGEILLVKRKVPPNENTWDLPGGFMDINESAEESVTRELWEELEIKITDFKYLKSYPDRYQFQKINYYTLMFVYEAQIPDQKFIEGGEIKDFKFFKKSEIPWDSLAFKSLKQALEEYLKTR